MCERMYDPTIFPNPLKRSSINTYEHKLSKTLKLKFLKQIVLQRET